MALGHINLPGPHGKHLVCADLIIIITTIVIIYNSVVFSICRVVQPSQLFNFQTPPKEIPCPVGNTPHFPLTMLLFPYFHKILIFP